MIIPESLILNTLRAGFSELAEGSAQQLMEVFDDDTALDTSRLFTFLNSKRLSIILGFPASPVKDTVIGLTLGANEEAEQFVGSAWDEEVAGLGSVVSGNVFSLDTYSTNFQASWRITIYSTNADLGVHLSYLAAYILLLKRANLTAKGLLEQKLSMTDFEPIPQYLPDIVFVRTLVFSAKTRVDYTSINIADVLREIEFVPVTN